MSHYWYLNANSLKLAICALLDWEAALTGDLVHQQLHAVDRLLADGMLLALLAPHQTSHHRSIVNAHHGAVREVGFNM